MGVINHGFDLLRIMKLPRDQWKGEIEKLSPDAREEIKPRLRIEWEKLFYADQIKDGVEKMKEHDKLVQDTKRKSRK